MIVRDEEAFLPQCLASVKDAVDEIIVVDTGSTDRTIEIARSFGATVIEREWRNDFAWARNESIALATKRWILFMDADEELVESSRAQLSALKSMPAYDHALWVRIYNRTDDYRGSGDVSHALIRIFPNHESIRFRGLIHEFPAFAGSEISINAVASDVAIVHHGYVQEVVASRNKGARNLSILLAATAKEPGDPYHWYNLGTTAYVTHDVELARTSLERMLALVGDDSRAFMPNGITLLGDIYVEHMGDPARGEALAHLALKRSPHYANGHMMLGKALVAQRRFDEARAAFAAAIDDGAFAKNQFIVDDQVYIWKAQSETGSSYAEQGNDLKALEWFDKGLANAPNVEPLILNRAKALERLGRQSEAYEAFKKAFETHGSVQSMLYFVNYLLRVQRGGEALLIVDEWYLKLPPYQAAELLLGASGVSERYGMGKEEHYLRLAADLQPACAPVLEQLERVLRARGKEEELRGYFEREFSGQPVSPQDWARRARRALDERRADLALTAADNALAHDPKSFELHMTRAGALELLASPAGVEASLLAAREIDPLRASVGLSMFYLHHERFAEAAAIAERTLNP
jgi:tetratricopeptide (TPR) repeat protein